MIVLRRNAFVGPASASIPKAVHSLPILLVSCVCVCLRGHLLVFLCSSVCVSGVGMVLVVCIVVSLEWRVCTACVCVCMCVTVCGCVVCIVYFLCVACVFPYVRVYARA